MNKKNKIIILICTIFVILTIISIYYFLTRKTYSLEVYQYTYNNKTLFSSSVPTTGVIQEKYIVKCKNECSLINNEYEYNYFGVSNNKEGYIYNISTDEIYDVDSFTGFTLLSRNNNDDIGLILSRKEEKHFSNSFFNINMKKVTIAWTDKFVIGFKMINDEIVDTINSNYFINITTGKVYEVSDYKSFKCYTPNTCLFQEESGYGFIYNFKLDNQYLINYDAIIDYIGGAIVLSDNKYMNLDFKNNNLTYIIDKPNYKNIYVGNSYINNNLNKNEIILSFEINKDMNDCPTYLYDTSTQHITSFNNCSYFE